MPGQNGYWWMLAKSTSREPWKIVLVPFPWWTSQSRTSTRSAPSASSAWRAAIATLANRQKPIARANSAWWPGGRSAEKPTRSPPREQRLHQRAGAAGGAQRRLERTGARGGVEVEGGAARAHLPDELDVLGRMHAQELLLARTRGVARLPAQRRLSRSTRLGRVRTTDLPRSTRLGRVRTTKHPTGFELGLDRAYPVRALGVAGTGVVIERGGMAKEERHGRRYGTCAPWRSRSAPMSQSWAPAPPASTPRWWPPAKVRAWRS